MASALFTSAGFAGSTLGVDAALLASGLTAVMVRLTEAEGFSASAVFAAAGAATLTGTGAVPGAVLKASTALTGSDLASTAFAGATVLATAAAGLAVSGTGLTSAALTGAGAVLAVSAAFTGGNGRDVTVG